MRPRPRRARPRRSRCRLHAPVAHRDAALRKILHAQRIAERVRQFFELEHFFRIRFFVHAMQRSDAALLEILRHGFVRRQHEFLDDPVRDIPLAAHDAEHAPLVVELDDRFGQIEINRAARDAPLVQQQRQLLHAPEIRSTSGA